MAFEQLFKQRVPTPEQMHTLVKFVECGSLSEAFGKGKSAQAAATQQLSRIDACLGIRTRKSSGFYKVPTDEARELAAFSRDFFQKLEDFKMRAERKPNSFVIGAGESLIFYLLIPALRGAGKWRQSVQFQLENLRSKEIVAGLLNGSIDIGLVRTNAIKGELLRQKRLKMEKISRLTYAFCVNRELLKDYRGDFADDQALTTWSAKHIPLASFWSEHSTFTTALNKADIRLSTQFRCESFPLVKEAVVSGNYFGILPVQAFGEELPDGIHLFGSKLLTHANREIGLVWSSSLSERRQGGSTILKELLRLLKKGK